MPRIATRGRYLLDQIVQLLQAYGYAVRESKHDCGRLGRLAQSRKRFLLLARHAAKVPPFLYEPEQHALRAVGDVLGRMPLPGDLRVGPMHRLPALQWKTWVRLAFVEAGSDWRSLKKLRVENGVLADYLLVPEMHRGVYGVTGWQEAAATVTGNGRPATGKFSVADPMVRGHAKSVQLGVRRWDQVAGVVTGKMFAGGGPNSVADPRVDESNGRRFNNVYRVVRWTEASPAVTAGAHPTAGGAAVADPRPGYGDSTHHNVLAVTEWNDAAKTITAGASPSAGGQAVADPRPDWKRHSNNLSVVDWEEPAPTVIAGGKGVQGGWLSVADPRPACVTREGDHYETGGHYGVVPWDQPANVIAGNARHDNGFNNVADPRLPAADDRLVALIIATDGTYHRPFTTFEMAGLQSLVEPEEWLELDGLSDSAWRERIGNAIPPEAMEAIAGVIGTTLLLAWSGETFRLSSTPIWVRDVAVALSVGSA